MYCYLRLVLERRSGDACYDRNIWKYDKDALLFAPPTCTSMRCRGCTLPTRSPKRCTLPSKHLKTWHRCFDFCTPYLYAERYMHVTVETSGSITQMFCYLCSLLVCWGARSCWKHGIDALLLVLPTCMLRSSIMLKTWHRCIVTCAPYLYAEDLYHVESIT